MAYNARQQALIRRFLPHIDFEHLSDDDWVDIEDKVGDYYTDCCMDDGADKQADIALCEEILDALPREP